LRFLAFGEAGVKSDATDKKDYFVDNLHFFDIKPSFRMINIKYI
jgi:hypothetical protein